MSAVDERKAQVRKAERNAFLSLALRQRQLSWKYRKWALEDEASGNLKAYLKHASEARRLWREALWHLDRARSRTWH